jgi:hypothetical protein
MRSTFSFPFRDESAELSIVEGSPDAVNFAVLCVPSQNGLLLDCPQRQSVARVPAGLPSISRSARRA